MAVLALGSDARRYVRNSNWPLAAGGILIAFAGILCIRSAGLHAPSDAGEFSKQILYLLLGIPVMFCLSLSSSQQPTDIDCC